MSVNRKRNIQVIMRLTEEEQEILTQRMHDSGARNMQAYLREMALAGYIIRLDMSEVRETLRLIANATSNINQLAKRANETRSIYAADMIQLREEMSSLRSQAADAFRVFRKVQMLMEI